MSTSGIVGCRVWSCFLTTPMVVRCPDNTATEILETPCWTGECYISAWSLCKFCCVHFRSEPDFFIKCRCCSFFLIAMPIQAPQWTDFLACPVCCNNFDVKARHPISLGCAHTVCKSCLSNLPKKQCPFDQVSPILNIRSYTMNTSNRF